MDAVSPFIILDGEYTMDGKLLLFALNAHGKANVTQGKCHFNSSIGDHGP